MRKISAVGLFCCDKFEETPKQKVINMSKLNKLHFSYPFSNSLRNSKDFVWVIEFLSREKIYVVSKVRFS